MKVSNEIKVALVVILGVVMFLLGFNFLNGTSLLESENTFYTHYENVEGLQVGTNVTVNGLTVGKVKSIEFSDDLTRMIVSFSLRNDILFSSNSKAELYEAGLIGGKSIAIQPTFDKAPKFKDGDTIEGIVKPGLTDVVNQQIAPLQQKLESAISNADSLFIGVNNILDTDGQNNLSQTIEDLSTTIKSIQSAANTLDLLLANQSKNLESTFENIAVVSENMNQLTDSLLQSNLKQTLLSFESTVSSLSILLAEIEKGEGNLGKLFKEEGLYENIENSTNEINALIKDLKEHPKRYVHFSLFGKKEKPYQEIIKEK